VKAKLVDAAGKWPFSSACDRARHGIMAGEPLLPLPDDAIAPNEDAE